MKENIFSAIKQVLADRLMTVLVLFMITISLVYCVYVAISLLPSDLQVAVHYTAYGETNFYREKWHYLISFIVFGLVVAIIHTMLVVKLYVQERRQLAVLFAWISIMLIVVAWAVIRSVLRVAFP